MAHGLRGKNVSRRRTRHGRVKCLPNPEDLSALAKIAKSLFPDRGQIVRQVPEQEELESVDGLIVKAIHENGHVLSITLPVDNLSISQRVLGTEATATVEFNQKEFKRLRRFLNQIPL